MLARIASATCLAVLLVASAAVAAPAQRTQVRVGPLAHPDGSPHLGNIVTFLAQVPTMRADMEIVQRLAERGRVAVRYEDEMAGLRGPSPVYVVADNTGKAYVVVKRHLEAKHAINPADLVYVMAHEFGHIADRERLAALLVKREARLPKQLLSRERSDLPSPHVTALPGGYFVDASLFQFMTEQRSYYTQNRLYNALRRNDFAAIEFVGDEHFDTSITPEQATRGLSGRAITVAPREGFERAFPQVDKALLVRALAAKGLPADRIRALRLDGNLSPVRAHVLASYLAANPPPNAGAIDIHAPYVDRYANLSIKQILSGALLQP